MTSDRRSVQSGLVFLGHDPMQWCPADQLVLVAGLDVEQLEITARLSTWESWTIPSRRYWLLLASHLKGLAFSSGMVMMEESKKMEDQA